MNALQNFQFHTHQLQVIVDENGEPWFIAMQVAEILEYSDAHKMTGRLDEDEKSNRQIGGLGPETGGRGITCINESGLYSAILTSKKPAAKTFKRWVTHEVLPAIRKTGQYIHQAPEPKTQKALPNGLTLDQQDAIKQLVKDRVAEMPKEKQAKAAITCWSSIKSKYGCGYKEVSPEHFTSIVSLLARLPLEGELMPPERKPALPTRKDVDAVLNEFGPVLGAIMYANVVLVDCLNTHPKDKSIKQAVDAINQITPSLFESVRRVVTLG